jgi:hypothetical protein
MTRSTGLNRVSTPRAGGYPKYDETKIRTGMWRRPCWGLLYIIMNPWTRGTVGLLAG